MKIKSKLKSWKFLLTLILLIAPFWEVLIGVSVYPGLTSIFNSSISRLSGFFLLISFSLVYYMWWNSSKKRQVFYFIFLLWISVTFFFTCSWFDFVLNFHGSDVQLEDIFPHWIVWFIFLGLILTEYIIVKKQK